MSERDDYITGVVEVVPVSDRRVSEQTHWADVRRNNNQDDMVMLRGGFPEIYLYAEWSPCLCEEFARIYGTIPERAEG